MSSNRKGMGGARVLVTGGSGFLGGYVLERLARSYEVHAGLRRGRLPYWVASFPLELTNQRSIEAARRLAPSYVVHNAAVTRPGVCQEDPDTAYAVNVEGTRLLAEAVRDSCIRFIYCSTDLVFDGTRPASDEMTTPSPLMTYGRTKLEGEAAARAALGDRAMVTRLALLYGRGRGRSAGRTFTETTLEEARRGRAVPLFTDQYRSPLYVEDAAAGVAAALTWPDPPAVVHLGGPQRLSRFEMGVETLEVFSLDRSLALAVRMEDVPSRVPRPQDVSFDIQLARSMGFDPLAVRKGLVAMRAASGQDREV